jgi:protein-tyrosine-phosphatase
VQSADSQPNRLHPYTALPHDELGIDTSTHHTEDVTSIDPTSFDSVIALCDEEVHQVFLSDAQRQLWAVADLVREREDLTDEQRLHSMGARW